MDFRFIYLYYLISAECTKCKGIKKPYSFVLYNSVCLIFVWLLLSLILVITDIICNHPVCFNPL